MTLVVARQTQMEVDGRRIYSQPVGSVEVLKGFFSEGSGGPVLLGELK
ncbi:hypothetical protein EVB32_171 [Rhizobium phage RHph_TM39]|nr:hypothetical protein EVB32_171 [Rhizobium phage RHph_TM39]